MEEERLFLAAAGFPLAFALGRTAVFLLLTRLLIQTETLFQLQSAVLFQSSLLPELSPLLYAPLMLLDLEAAVVEVGEEWGFLASSSMLV